MFYWRCMKMFRVPHWNGAHNKLAFIKHLFTVKSVDNSNKMKCSMKWKLITLLNEFVTLQFAEEKIKSKHHSNLLSVRVEKSEQILIFVKFHSSGNLAKPARD